PSPPHDAVHRPHQGRRLGDPVEMLHDRDLVGRRHVAAAEAHRPEAADGVGQPLGLDLELDVAPVESVMAEHRLDHRLGGILGDRLPEEAAELRLEVHARISFTTSPWTSVSRMSRPPNRTVSRLWSTPRRWRIVACRSCISSLPWTAL